MTHTDVIVIGAGQAGLAMSHCLARTGVDHIVLERRRIAERWLSERWDTLRLLTPNWFTRLPGQIYDGPDPDGFMSMQDVAGLLRRYAQKSVAPVVECAPVTSLSSDGTNFQVETPAGSAFARSVVIATGACERPAIPDCAAELATSILQMPSRDYRRPSALPPGGILVVGASASGLQIARELHAAGREVTLSVGRHTRVPRRYRGQDIIWLMDRAGILGESIAEVFDPDRTRHQPSMQLAGGTETMDLATLKRDGLRVFGRLDGIAGTKASFDAGLKSRMEAADAKLVRLIARIDSVAARTVPWLPSGEPIAPIAFGAEARVLDLATEGISTVIWATGFRRCYPWLHLPVIGNDGDIAQAGGVTGVAGLFTLGMPFQRRRKSTFIDGVGDDAEALMAPILTQLSPRNRAAA